MRWRFFVSEALNPIKGNVATSTHLVTVSTRSAISLP